MISFEEFKKLDIRIAEIKEVEEIPGSDKLWKIKIDLGEEKTIVAGIKESHSKEELIGKQIVVINNLEPAKIRGVESQAMLLAVDQEQVVLLIPEKNVKPGSKVS